MRVRAFLFAVTIPCLLLNAVAQEARNQLSLPQLQAAISAHAGHERFSKAVWGIKVLSLESGAVLFETNAHKLLKAASNGKVFTAALALDKLGPDSRIRTSILAKEGPDARGVLRGDLIVFGRGDPSFAARFSKGNYSNLLGRLVEVVKRKGIKEVTGDLVGDETFFRGPPLGSGWTWDDLQYYYGAEISALSLQDNVVDLYIRPGDRVGSPCVVTWKPESGANLTGAAQFPEFGVQLINQTVTGSTNVPASISVFRPLKENRVYLTGSLPKNYGTHVDAVTVPNPARWFVEVLREELKRSGIVVRGGVRTRSWPEDKVPNPKEYREVAFTESPPIREIVEKMLKPSQNLYAQLLLLQVGANSKSPAQTTEEAGVKALNLFLKRAGVPTDEVLLEEGSGLSRSSLVTGSALVEVLRYMAKHPSAEIFRNAFPAPGEGTLRTRFRDWKEGHPSDLRAKTGSLRYVNSLSGYVQSASGERLVFAIILNAYDGPSSGRDEVERVVRILADYGGSPAPRN